MVFTKENRREMWIDALRGFAIILVIVGHAYNVPSAIKTMIYGFHMPLFFVLSGFLFHPEHYADIYSFSEARFKQYVVPYFVLGGVNLIIQAIIEASDMSLTKLIKSAGAHFIWLCYSWSTSKKMPNCTPLWFLPTLFLSAIFLYAFLEQGGYISGRKKSHSLRIAVFAIVIAAVTAMLYLGAKEINLLPWHFDMAVAGFIFMIFGYGIRSFVRGNRKWYTFLPLLIIGLGTIYRNGGAAMASSHLHNPVLFFIGACATSLSLLLLFRRFCNVRLWGLEYVGRNTMIVIGFNYVFKNLVNYLCGVFLIRKGSYYWVFQSIAVYILCLITILLWNVLKKKFPQIAIF